MHMEKKFNWRTPVIAIDFDGCLCKDEFPDIGTPNWETIREANRLQNNGACLILWTCREGELLMRICNAMSGIFLTGRMVLILLALQQWPWQMP